MTTRLRPLRPSDDDPLRALFADPLVALWNPGPDDVPRWRAENSELADDFRTYVITDDSGELLGVVSVFSIEDATHTAELGFRVAPAARGRGLGRAGAGLALAAVATERDVRTVQAWHAVENAASCRVLAACGFALDSTHPANHRYGDGDLHDEHRHVRRLA